jgi:hypothetical protein
MILLSNLIIDEKLPGHTGKLGSFLTGRVEGFLTGQVTRWKEKESLFLVRFS